MSRYRIEVEREALCALKKLDKPIRRRIQTAIDRLADDPRPRDVKALKDSANLLRARVVDYRIVYEVHDSVLVVLVVDLGHRPEIYRRC